MVNKRTEIGMFVIAVSGLLLLGMNMKPEEKEMPTIAKTHDLTNRLIDERITRVMRYSGPKMIRKHPLLAINHLLKAKGIGRRKKGSRA